MQVQSSADPPKKLALGERAVMADGNEYNLVQLKEKGEPVEIVYPTEGTPIIIGPSGVMKDAPNPNAARLLQCFMFSAECQQLMVDFGGLRSFHALVKDKAGRKPLGRDQADEGRCRRRREARPTTSRRAIRGTSRFEAHATSGLAARPASTPVMQGVPPSVAATSPLPLMGRGRGWGEGFGEMANERARHLR